MMRKYECPKCKALINWESLKPLKMCVCGNNKDFALLVAQITKEEEETSLSRLRDIYFEIIDILKNYIDTSEDNYKIIAIWIIGTYFHKRFYTYPYLFFNAMRGSSKTRTLRLIASMASKGSGSVQNNITEAVLFRIPQGTTTCIDEVEQINDKAKQTLRELLNSAYKKGMQVCRVKKVSGKDGEKFVTEVFEPYFPIAIANIWGLDEVLADRAIPLILEKSDNPFVVYKIEDFKEYLEKRHFLEKITQESDVSDVTLHSKIYIYDWNDYINERYAKVNGTNITNYTTLLTPLTSPKKEDIINKIERDEFFNKIHDLKIVGRNFELSFPLLIIAKLLGTEVFDDFCNVMLRVIKSKKEEEYSNSKDVCLYQYISGLEEGSLRYHSIKNLTSEFRLFVGEQDYQDMWLNEKWMGRALKRLNLTLQSQKTNRGKIVVLNVPKAREKAKLFAIDDKDNATT